MTVTILPFSFADGEITLANWNSFYGNNGRFYPELIAPFQTFGLSEADIEHSIEQHRSIHRVLTETEVPFLYAMEDQSGLIVDNQTVTPLGKVHLYQR